MSILSAIRQQSSSIDDLAKLPQAMIMQMAQRKQIATEMVAPILARKAEMIDATAKTKAMQGGVPPTSVMEQIIAQNAQSEHPPMHHQMQQPMPQQMPQHMQQPMPQQMPQQMEDTGVAQLPIPEREYAGGGIIAFADGGLSDEDQDYEDSLEEADYNNMIERAMNAGEEDYNPRSASNQTPQFETRHAKGSPQSFPNSGIASLKPESSGDLDARLRAAIMQKESGGRRYDKEGRLLTSSKGAEGEMQVMPHTARDPGFGIRPARDNSPDELKRVGDEYASVLLRRYRDPKLAMIAYNMGPGATDKWLAAGADPRKLPKETQGYIRNVTLAGGGEVQHFKNEGKVKEKDYDKSSYESDRLYGDTYVDPEMFNLPNLSFGSKLLEPTPRIRDKSITPVENSLQKEFGIPKLGSSYENSKQIEPKKVVPPTMPDELKNVSIGSKPPSAQDFRDFDQAAALFQAENMGKNAPAQAQEAPKSRLDEYMDRLIAREGNLEKQKSQDANLALLSAGLGMMGGTSRYALENIGKGALAGVQNFTESSKQRAAEQAALDKSMLYANRYQGAEDIAKQNAAYNQGMKKQQYELDVQKHGTEREKIAINQYNTHIKNQLDALIAKNPTLLMDEVAKQKAINDINNEEITLQLRKKAFPDLPVSSPRGTAFTPKQESLLSKYLPK
jgi:hypothetical protein